MVLLFTKEIFMLLKKAWRESMRLGNVLNTVEETFFVKVLNLYWSLY